MRLIIVVLLALILLCLFRYNDKSLTSSLILSEKFSPIKKSHNNFDSKWRQNNIMRNADRIEKFSNAPSDQIEKYNDPEIPKYTKYQLDLYGIPKNTFDIVRNVAYIAVIPTDEVHIFRVKENTDVFQSHIWEKPDEDMNEWKGSWDKNKKVYYVGCADQYDKIHFFQCPFFPIYGEKLMFYTRNTPDDPFNNENKEKYIDPLRPDGAMPGAFKSYLACHIYHNYNWYVSNPDNFKIVAIEDKAGDGVPPEKNDELEKGVEGNHSPLWKSGQPMNVFSSGYKRLGCYYDNGSMNLMDEAFTGDTDDITRFEIPNQLRFDHVNCRNYAKANGKSLFAVKSGGKCYTWVDDGERPNPISSGAVPDLRTIGGSISGIDGFEACKQGLVKLTDSQSGLIDNDNISGGYNTSNSFPTMTKGYLRNFEGMIKPYPVTTGEGDDKVVSTGKYVTKIDERNHAKYLPYRTSSTNKTIDIHMVHENPEIRLTGDDMHTENNGKIYGNMTALKYRTDDVNNSLMGRLKDGARTIQPDVGGSTRMGPTFPGGNAETAMAYGNNLWGVYIQYQLVVGNNAFIGEQEICPDPNYLEFNSAGCTNYSGNKDDCVESMKPGYYVNESLCQNTINEVVNENQYNNVTYFTFINRFFSILYTYTDNIKKLQKDKEKDPQRYTELTDEKIKEFNDQLESLKERINIPYRNSINTACQLLSMVHGFNPEECSRDIPRLQFTRADGADQGDKYYSLIVNASYDFKSNPGNPSENEENKKKHKSLRDKLNADILEFLKLGKIFVFKANELFNSCSCQGTLGKKCTPC